MALGPETPGPSRVTPPWRKHYLPEIHDVSPAMETTTEDLLAMLPERARPHALFLIVPDWQGRNPITADVPCPFASLSRAGVLHGLTHSLGRTWISWALYNQDDRSEFARLSADQATARLDRAEAMWRDALGTQTPWFCAPRWEQSRATSKILQDRGYAGYFLKDRIVRFGKTAVPAPAMNYDVGGRQWMSRLSRPARLRQARSLIRLGIPFRLALHPTDPRDPATVEEISWLTSRLEADGWRPLSLMAFLSAYDATRADG